MSPAGEQRGHVIVGGMGHLGGRVAAQLCARGVPVVVIEQAVTTAQRREAARLECTLIEGDILDEQVLVEAGVTRAAAFVAATDDDGTNLRAAMMTRRLAPQARVVVRLFDQTLAQHVERIADVNALSASALASPAFVSAATDESIVAMLTVDGNHLCFRRGEPGEGPCLRVARRGAELRIAAEGGGCVLVSLEREGAAARRRPTHHARRGASRLASLHPTRIAGAAGEVWRRSAAITRVLLVALLLSVVLSVGLFWAAGHLSPVDALYFVVTTMTTVGYGDFNLQHAPVLLKLYGVVMMLAGAALLATVYALIAEHVLAARLEYLLGRRPVDLTGHTVVVGLGKVGYRVARDLQVLGVEVVAVEANDDSDNVSAARALFPVIIGNAARRSVQRNAGVAEAAAVLALTDDPMVNLSVALEAKAANPRARIIVRTYDPELAETIGALQLDAVLSTSAIASPVFADAALTPGVEGSFEVDGEEVLLVRRRVEAGSPLAGKTPCGVGEELGVAVVAVAASAGRTQYRLADAEAPLMIGDSVLILCARERVQCLGR